MWVLLAAVLGFPASLESRQADQASLARIARGDQAEFAELYDRHARLVYSLPLRILQDRADAEDVVQEVFAQVWAQPGRYDASRGAVVAWMLTPSRAIDRLRAKRVRPETAADAYAAENVPDVAAAQDFELLSAEQVTRLQRALKELPDAQRTALELALLRRADACGSCSMAGQSKAQQRERCRGRDRFHRHLRFLPLLRRRSAGRCGRHAAIQGAGACVVI